MQRFPYTDSSGVQILSKVSPQFEELYLRALRKENRIYSDAEVKELPKAFFYNLHRQEWALREKNSNRLLTYLRKIQGHSRLLDLGCGNGWFANRVARMEPFEVWGLDINLFALQQAQRVLNAPNLNFAYGDIFEDIFPAGHFDCIILNQTIEFFPDLIQLINRCRYFLKSGGEIHIIDSPLYQEKELDSARQKASNTLNPWGFRRCPPSIFTIPEIPSALLIFSFCTNPGACLARMILLILG